jgi:hypothetical protein
LRTERKGRKKGRGAEREINKIDEREKIGKNGEE